MRKICVSVRRVTALEKKTELLEVLGSYASTKPVD